MPGCRIGLDLQEVSLADGKRRNPLLPWFIGLAIIIATVVIIAIWMIRANCAAPGIVQFIVLAIIPVVYLTLAYLTFRSQD
jgi:hypothetical protein